MAEFILNPRRTPRAPVRCRAEVAGPHGPFESDTEDIGSMGCQVVSPRVVRKGDGLYLSITNEKVAERLEVSGRVAWVAAQAPWRVGVAFDEGCLSRSARWFDRLLSAYPGLAGYRKVPDRIPTDATVYLGPPPRFLLDFTADETMLLRAIASGARVDELMARLRSVWPAAQRALFSLIARQAVTLLRGQAVRPDAWRKVLTEVEAALAVESLGAPGMPFGPGPGAPPRERQAATPAPAARSAGTPLPGAHATVSPARTPPPAARTPVPSARTPPPSARTPVPAALTPVPAARTPVPPRQPPAGAGGWKGGQPHDGTRQVDFGDDGPTLEIGTLDHGTPTPPGAVGAPRRPGFAGAGVGWRGGSPRSPEAQATFERALAEIEASNVPAALALLRRALSLAPGDAEIAQVLGQLSFGNRMPER
jgi:hypothetical protein